METQTIVAAFSLLGVIATAIAGFLVARMTNRTEKAKAAEVTAEAVLRERLGVAGDRLVLRDEQMDDLKGDLQKAIAERDRAMERADHLGDAIDARDMVIRELREELERMIDDDKG